MPKAKIFLLYESYNRYGEETTRGLSDGFSDWEDISDSDLNYIQANIYRIKTPPGTTPVLVVADDKPLVTRISDIRKDIEKEVKLAEAMAAGRLAKAEAIRKKKAERERERITQVLKDNPELAKEILRASSEDASEILPK